jgi:hypothetical protein
MAAKVIPFNPLDKAALGKSVADALLAQAVVPLSQLQSFGGAGVYAIYYTGAFVPYTLLAAANREGRYALPIYVGKAVPAGARKGGGASDVPDGPVLFKRLAEHRQGIDDSSNLQVADFACRHLVVDDIWIPLGESLLIAQFSPLWNVLVDGFGNHDPGRGRQQGMRPRWDTLHPGRAWASQLKERMETADQIANDAKTFLAARRP